MKNITFDCFTVFGRVQKVMQSTAGSIKFIRVVDFKIIISGKIHRNAENLYLRCENIPILWKKYYAKIANDRECVANRFIQHCRERHFYNFK